MDNPTKATVAASVVLVVALIYIVILLVQIDDRRATVISVSAMLLMGLYAWVRYKIATHH